MEAIVTVIDDDGRVLVKDHVIYPCGETIEDKKGYVPIKRINFEFEIIQFIDDMIVGKKKPEELQFIDEFYDNDGEDEADEDATNKLS